MSFVGGSPIRRSQKTGRRGWVRMVGPVGLVLFLAAVAMTSVWQNVQFTRATLALEKARRRNDALLSDWNSQHMKLGRDITMSQLAPKAKKRFGLVDSSTEDMRLVAFDQEIDRTLPRDPGFLDRLVPEAVARESRSSRNLEEEAGAVDQERP
jgi:hypothetical protein